jgi:sugar/nucleoside kinase (ribokinase family)
MQYAGWSVIVDDIVFPDGRTAMAVLGGGGSYTVAGMRVWSPDVGIFAQVGPGFDAGILDRLALRETSLRPTDRLTPRAWQLFEADGHRTQIPRVPPADWTAQLSWPPDFAEWLAAHGVRAAHLLSRGLPGDPEMLSQIAARGVRVSLEPIIEDGMDAAHRDRVLAALPYVEIFSPGAAELRALLGDTPPQAALADLSERGPEIVALRRGAAGSLVYQRGRRGLLRVPAAPAQVVDVTGAGNAYAGGMLVGWCESRSLETAATCAAVSAAVTIEQIGPPTITPAMLDDAKRRQVELLAELSELDDTT